MSIALSVFERWGLDGLRFLIGDWSIAIWDGAKRTLHLARDYMGVRPLYYCATDRSVMWSSSLGELAQRTGRVDALSEEFVASVHDARTLERHRRRTKASRGAYGASCVASCIFRNRDDGGDSGSSSPDVVRFRDKRQYEEQLRALWSEAVGCAAAHRRHGVG